MCQSHKVHSQAHYLLLFCILLHCHGRPQLPLPHEDICLINQNHLDAGFAIAVPSVPQSRLSPVPWQTTPH